MKAIQNSLTSVTSCNDLVAEIFSWMLEEEGSLKQQKRLEKCVNAKEIALYRKRAAAVLKKLVEICPTE